MNNSPSKSAQYLACLLFFASQLWPVSSFAVDVSKVWGDVQSGKSIVILRHALAPGTGDPANFDVTRCETQRNLSDEGIQQAHRIGAQLKKYGLVNATVYTSQWCRCIDTANAMDINDATELPLLNSFYENPQAGPEQIRSLLQWIGNLGGQQPAILVTHQVVISALTGVFPASGEAVVFTLTDDNSVEVVHRLAVK